MVVAAGGAAVKLFAGGNGKIENIGVMPIQDISKHDSVFVNALHDGLTNALSKLSVGVATHSDMMRYKGGAKTTREVAKENGLNAVVEATVFRAGDVMRINVQFTDPVTSKSLSFQTTTRSLTTSGRLHQRTRHRLWRGVGRRSSVLHLPSLIFRCRFSQQTAYRWPHSAW